MKNIVLITLVAILGLALIGCETTTETNSDNAVVTNDNANVVENTNAGTEEAKEDEWTWDKDMTREDFDKDKEKYEEKAEKEAASIGDGADDLWIWTKTRAALATTENLRDSTINVDVANNVVTLKGTVGSEDQKRDANQVAKNIEGVKEVKDELKVEANEEIGPDKEGEANTDKKE